VKVIRFHSLSPRAGRGFVARCGPRNVNKILVLPHQGLGLLP
jgi:hypothetical protein